MVHVLEQNIPPAKFDQSPGFVVAEVGEEAEDHSIQKIDVTSVVKLATMPMIVPDTEVAEAGDTPGKCSIHVDIVDFTLFVLHVQLQDKKC